MPLTDRTRALIDTHERKIIASMPVPEVEPSVPTRAATLDKIEARQRSAGMFGDAAVSAPAPTGDTITTMPGQLNFGIVPAMPMRKRPLTEGEYSLPREVGRQIVGGISDVGGAVGLGLEAAGRFVEEVGGKSDMNAATGTEAMKIPGLDRVLKPVAERLRSTGKEVGQYWGDVGDQYQQSADIVGNVVDRPELLADPKWWASNVARMGPGLAAAIMAGIASGGATTMLGGTTGAATLAGSVFGGTAGGLMEGAGTKRDALKRGMTEDEAVDAGTKMALASGILNAISLDATLNPSARNALARFMISGTTEALTEAAEEPAEGVIFGEDWDQFAERLKNAVTVMGPAFLTGAAGGVIAGGKPGPDTGRKRVFTPEEVNLDGRTIDTETGEVISEEPSTQKPKPGPKFKVGDTVTFKDGTFAEITGRFHDRITGPKGLWILVDENGKEHHLTPEQLASRILDTQEPQEPPAAVPPAETAPPPLPSPALTMANVYGIEDEQADFIEKKIEELGTDEARKFYKGNSPVAKYARAIIKKLENQPTNRPERNATVAVPEQLEAKKPQTPQPITPEPEAQKPATPKPETPEQPETPDEYGFTSRQREEIDGKIKRMKSRVAALIYYKGNSPVAKYARTAIDRIYPERKPRVADEKQRLIDEYESWGNELKQEGFDDDEITRVLAAPDGTRTAIAEEIRRTRVQEAERGTPESISDLAGEEEITEEELAAALDEWEDIVAEAVPEVKAVADEPRETHESEMVTDEAQEQVAAEPSEDVRTMPLDQLAEWAGRKGERTPGYVGEGIKSILLFPDQHNKKIVQEEIKRYLDKEKNAYKEYKAKVNKLPELQRFIDEYDAAQRVYDTIIKQEPTETAPEQDEQKLIDANVLVRTGDGIWKYKFVLGDTFRWITANSKEDAVKQAKKAFNEYQEMTRPPEPEPKVGDVVSDDELSDIFDQAAGKAVAEDKAEKPAPKPAPSHESQGLLPQAPGAKKYISRIQNGGKMQYAHQYDRWLRRGMPEGEEPERPAGLSYMAAQGVRQALDPLYSTPVNTKASTALGKNSDGNPVYADKNGNRYYIEKGVRVEAPVPLALSRNGLIGQVSSPDLLFEKGQRRWLTTKEIAAFEEKNSPSLHLDFTEKTDHLKTAGDELAAGMADIGKMIKLFTEGERGSFSTKPAEGFDAERYAQLKVLMDSSYTHFAAAGRSIAEWMRTLIEQFGKAGISADTIKPYVMKFYNEKTDQSDTEHSKTSENIVSSGPSKKIAEWVGNKLKQKVPFTSQELFRVADEAYGGTQADGKYSSKDAYDALELGVNQRIGDDISINAANSNEELAQKSIVSLKKLISILPTQGAKRTEEMVQFQQFSTPPPLAFAVNWVANIDSNDHVLEPSAGIGGIAVFAKNAGAKTVTVNELSKRRAALLRSLDFTNIFTEDAEQLHNILPGHIKPTVVVMNPPFSSTAGRVSTNNTKNAGRHIEQALYRLQKGGRLVAIVGRGMADNAPSFREWWKKIKAEYSVLANIGISGKEYKKYGTEFDNRILVIDKTGPSVSEPITGAVEHIEDLIPLLKGVRDARQRVVREGETAERGNAAESSGRDAAVQGENEQGLHPGGTAQSESAEVGGGHRTSKDGRRHGSDVGSDVSVGSRVGSERPVQEHGGERVSRGNGDTVSGRTGVDSGGKSDGMVAESGSRDTERIQPGTEFQGELKTQETENTEKISTDSIFENYTPRVTLQGAKPHPTPLVESAAMASVTAPKADYIPTIPTTSITTGKISDAQLEAVIRAGQAHSEMLPNGQRRGYFIGDGTGVGKGREIASIIWDNWNRGHKKAVWISESWSLINDAKRDLKGIGWNEGADRVFSAKSTKPGQRVQNTTGIMFLTYDTLRWKFNKIRKDTPGTLNDMEARVNQVVDWLGKDFDGVIVFDEAHALKNSTQQQGGRGRKEASQMAQAGVLLQNLIPHARILYVSATGATEVANLAYCERLGLWGEGTAFSNKQHFINRIADGGLAAMELVARDMKAMGLYTSRSLSYDGVEYDRITHDLTSDQKKIYDELAHAWQIVLQNIEKALEETNGPRGSAMSQFWGAHQRFFNSVVTSMQMPSIIQRIQNDITEGNAVILQLTTTGEASQERAIEKLKKEGGEYDDLDTTPRDNLIQYLERSFPVDQYELHEDENGNITQVPVVDSQGNNVLNAAAVAMRDRLIEDLASIKIPDSPLEYILDQLGYENVAEITGRKRRVVMDKKQGKKIVQARGEHAIQTDLNDFLTDRKRILVFSEKGGTGASYHADRTFKNQRKRIHYLVQPGWRAEVAIQGLGRSHRSNQVVNPMFVLVTTNLKAQMRFISTIARRLDQMGSLTRGQRQAGSQGIFKAQDNLESDYARDALNIFLTDLSRNAITGINRDDFQEQTGLVLDRSNARATIDIKQFLNRLLSLDIDMQNKVFDAFMERMNTIIEYHAQQGDLDVGMETITGENIKKVSEKIVHVDKKTGAKTRYVQLDVTRSANHLTFNDAKILYPTDEPMFYKNTKSGRIWVASKPRETTDQYGRVELSRTLKGAPHGSTQKVNVHDLEDSGNWLRLNDDAARELWDTEYNKLSPTVTERYHIMTGTLLPIWDRLAGRPTVYRMQTDGGERILGRWIHPDDLEATLGNLGVESGKIEVSGREVADRILHHGAQVRLANGWRLFRSTVSGDHRIEIGGPDYYSNTILRTQGAFLETIQYKARYFIPTDDTAGAVIDRIIEGHPIAKIEGGYSGPKLTERYSIRTPQSAGVTLADVKRMFPKARITEEADGSFAVHIGNRKPLIIRSVQEITPDKFRFKVGYQRSMKSDEVIAGKYNDGEITISRHGDRWTIGHEEYHWLEDIGVITPGDRMALNNEIARKTGKKYTTVTEEDRAAFVEEQLKKRAGERAKGIIPNIIQKVRDFIDGLVNLARRTARGVMRDIESGRMAERGRIGELERLVDSDVELGERYRGYDWDAGKSNNAVDAEASGRYPASKVAKMLGVPIEVVREYDTREYHHTGKYFNATKYYDVDEVRDWIKENPEEVARIKAESKATVPTTTSAGHTVSWLEWSGTRSHPRATRVTEQNVTIEDTGGKFLNVTMPNGKTVRKGRDTKGFEIDGKPAYLFKTKAAEQSTEGPVSPRSKTSGEVKGVQKDHEGMITGAGDSVKGESSARYSVRLSPDATREEAEADVERNLPAFFTEAAQMVRDVVLRRGENWSRDMKPDIGIIERYVSLLSHYAEKVPALRRAWEAAVRIPDYKIEFENAVFRSVDGGTKYLEVLDAYRKKNHEAKLWMNYIFTRDRDEIGYQVRPAGPDHPGVYNLVGNNGNIVTSSEDPEALWVDAIRREAAESPFSSEGKRALVAYRIVSHNIYHMLRKGAEEAISKIREAGGEMPKVPAWREGKQIEISLPAALALMGEKRGWYMPRIRKQGSYALIAKKQGENPVLEFFDTKSMLAIRSGELERKGYTVTKDVSRRLSEDVYAAAGSAKAVQDMLQAAIDRMTKGPNRTLTIKDFGLSVKWDKTDLILTGMEKHDYIGEILKKHGGNRHPMRGNQSQWVFKYFNEDKLNAMVRELAQQGDILFDPDLVFSQIIVDEVANVIRERGARVHMKKRVAGRGRDVWMGYEQDPITAITLEGKGVAGAAAKHRAAKEMIAAATGTDITWEQYRLKKGDGAKFSEYRKMVKARGIDPQRQKGANDAFMKLFQDILRNDDRVDRVFGVIKGLAVLKYLSFRLAAPLVNLTALPTSAASSISGYAGTSLTRAIGYLGEMAGQYTKFKTGRGVNAEDAALFEEIEKRGWHIAQFNREAITTLKSKFGRTTDQIMDVGMFLFGATEQLNRAATIAAAYKAIKAKSKGPWTPEMHRNALTKAKRISDRAHAVYGKANSPEWARGTGLGANAARSMYVFRTFTHNYLLTMVDLAGGNANAKKAALWMATSGAILGGAGASVLFNVACRVLGLVGFDDAEEWIYRWIEEHLGDRAEMIARHGLPGLAGITIKGSLEIDLASMPTSILDFLGAPGSIVTDAAEGFRYLTKGEIQKGFEKALPLGASRMVQAVREATEGVTSRTNVPLFFGNEKVRLTPIEAAWKFFSFTPSRTAMIREKQWAEKEREQKYRDDRTDIYSRIRDYFNQPPAKRTPEKWAKILEDIREYNMRARKWNISPIRAQDVRNAARKTTRPPKKERLRGMVPAQLRQ